MQWEYSSVSLVEGLSSSSLASFLNDMGVEGWELVDLIDRNLVFKRPIRPSIKEWLEMWEAQLEARGAEIDAPAARHSCSCRACRGE